MAHLVDSPRPCRRVQEVSRLCGSGKPRVARGPHRLPRGCSPASSPSPTSGRGDGGEVARRRGAGAAGGAGRVLVLLDAHQGLARRRSRAHACRAASAPKRSSRPSRLGSTKRVAAGAASLAARPRGGAPPSAQRSCIVAPIAAGAPLLGLVYADIDGRFGRLGEDDRDALALLARHAACVLERLGGGAAERRSSRPCAAKSGS